MKEYIFRVWDKKKSIFISEEDYCIYKGNPIQVYTHVGDGYCQKDLATTSNGTGEFIEDDWVVQRYTGLVDSKGTRIFEGDILAENYTAEMAALGSDAHVGDVYFDSGAFLISGGGTLFDLTYSVTPNIVDGYSVVGNINENPNYL